MNKNTKKAVKEIMEFLELKGAGTESYLTEVINKTNKEAVKNKKYCPGCDKSKLRSEFNKNKSRYDSLQAYCRICTMKIAIERRRNKTDEVRRCGRNHIKRWRKRNRKRSREIDKRARKKHPERQVARLALFKAIAKGKITRPEFCSRCDNKKPQGHHPDYDKPLEVIWLCIDCHYKEHRKLKQKEK